MIKSAFTRAGLLVGSVIVSLYDVLLMQFILSFRAHIPYPKAQLKRCYHYLRIALFTLTLVFIPAILVAFVGMLILRLKDPKPLGWAPLTLSVKPTTPSVKLLTPLVKLLTLFVKLLTPLVGYIKVDGSIALYTLAAAALGGMLELARHISRVNALAKDSEKALRDEDYATVTEKYKEYLALHWTFLWPSQRMELHKWIADHQRQIDQLLREEKSNEAAELIHQSPLPLDSIENLLLYHYLQTVSLENLLKVVRDEPRVRQGAVARRLSDNLSRAYSIVSGVSLSQKLALKRALYNFLFYGTNQANIIDCKLLGKVSIVSYEVQCDRWEYRNINLRDMVYLLTTVCRRHFVLECYRATPTNHKHSKGEVEKLLSQIVSPHGYTIDNKYRYGYSYVLKGLCANKEVPLCAVKIRNRKVEIPLILSPESLRRLSAWNRIGKTPNLGLIRIAPLPIPLRRVIPLPLSREVQMKVLRRCLQISGKPSEPERWAGKQSVGAFHVEVAWEKAGHPRPPKSHKVFLPEEKVLAAFPFKCVPFRAGEASVSNLFVPPSFSSDLLPSLQKKKHHVVLGEPGSGKTWLAQFLKEKLGISDSVYHYSLAGHRTFPEELAKLSHYYRDTFLIVSEAEELIKSGISPKSVWDDLVKTIWNEKFFGQKHLFIKLVLPKDLEPFVRNSISVLHTPVELLEIRWSNEGLKELWLSRIWLCTQAGRSESSILDVVGGGPSPEKFRLKRKWMNADGSERWTKGVDEYLIALASGSPKCLMALGRRFLEHIAYMRSQSKGGSLDPEKEVYESLAMLLEAYYGLRAEPIPECQDVVRK